MIYENLLEFSGSFLSLANNWRSFIVSVCGHILLTSWFGSIAFIDALARRFQTLEKERITMCEFRQTKDFSSADVERLFLSVGWVSGKYPELLHKALLGSSCVFTAWEGNRLVGLVRVLDDGVMTAYVHYVLVDPQFQGRGIAGHLMGLVRQHYRNYLYIEVMPEESKNATFYQNHGFRIMDDGVAMQIVNPNFGQESAD